MTSCTTLSNVTVDQSTPPVTDDPMTSVSGAPITGDNASDDDIDDFLHGINMDYVSAVAPGITFLSFLMVLGLVGNTLVIVVYYRRFKPSVTRVYILAMAVCDFLINVLAIPMQIVMVRFTVTFYVTWGCKAIFVGNVAFVLFTGAILVAVAVDRQKAICRNRPGALNSVRGAYRAVVISAVVSVLVACPYAELVEDHVITFPHSNITGNGCAAADKYLHTPFRKVYLAVLTLLYIVCVTIMVVSYARIARYLWQHQATTTTLNRRSRCAAPNSNPPGASVKPVPARTSLMLFVFTVVFIINYLPTLVLWIVDEVDPKMYTGDLELNARFIFSRCRGLRRRLDLPPAVYPVTLRRCVVVFTTLAFTAISYHAYTSLQRRHTGDIVVDHVGGMGQCYRRQKTCPPPPPMFKSVRCLRTMDKDAFRDELQNALPPSPSADQLDATLRAALDVHAPVSRRRVRPSKSAPWYSNICVELRDAKCDRRRAERR
ncbi:neuropeptide FF receptor 1-like [Littorina saxatilis]|uniref:neuropeptide FF receptor 1-like n=1 Tax=Littorina saxatilis TaxID=31220 RepID=UPI0038B64C77